MSDPPAYSRSDKLQLLLPVSLPTLRQAEGSTYAAGGLPLVGVGVAPAVSVQALNSYLLAQPLEADPDAIGVQRTPTAAGEPQAREVRPGTLGPSPDLATHRPPVRAPMRTRRSLALLP